MISPILRTASFIGPITEDDSLFRVPIKLGMYDPSESIGIGFTRYWGGVKATPWLSPREVVNVFWPSGLIAQEWVTFSM